MPVEEPRTARDEFTVITLCGSMRFREEFERLDAELTLSGHVVLTPTALTPPTELNVEERALLGRLHLQKIAMADEILVVNVGGYVGESTRREIEHARSRGVLVRFLEPRATITTPTIDSSSSRRTRTATAATPGPA
jgi:hypothetical protein